MTTLISTARAAGPLASTALAGLLAVCMLASCSRTFRQSRVVSATELNRHAPELRQTGTAHVTTTEQGYLTSVESADDAGSKERVTTEDWVTVEVREPSGDPDRMATRELRLSIAELIANCPPVLPARGSSNKPLCLLAELEHSEVVVAERTVTRGLRPFQRKVMITGLVLMAAGGAAAVCASECSGGQKTAAKPVAIVSGLVGLVLFGFSLPHP